MTRFGPLALDELHATQREHVTLAADHALRAFLTALDPGDARIDRAANASPTELRMLSHTREDHRWPTTSRA